MSTLLKSMETSCPPVFRDDDTAALSGDWARAAGVMKVKTHIKKMSVGNTVCVDFVGFIRFHLGFWILADIRFILFHVNRNDCVIT